MKIVVIGGSGLIGSKLVNKLREQGHEAVAASPNSGVNTLTGEGLAEVLKGASVVVDVSNSPSWEDAAVLKFFETSTRNLLTYEAAAGVGHHVALSVVGTDQLSESGYFRAKIAQEKLIKESSIPYSIVHATQFFEFVKGIADISIDGGKVHLPPVLFQPMAADDVATAVGKIAVGQPVNGIVEIGGPEQFRLDELVRRRLATLKDPREVVADPNALYSGAKISERTLVPGNNALLGETRFETWLTQPAAQIPSAHPQPTGVAVAIKRNRVMKKLADIAAATPLVSGIWERTPAVGRRPHTTRLHNSPSVCTSHAAGRTDTTSKIGCVPNRNSCGTTRNGEVPTKTHDALK